MACRLRKIPAMKVDKAASNRLDFGEALLYPDLLPKLVLSRGDYVDWRTL